MTEDVLITLPPKDPLAKSGDPIDLAGLEDRTWAAGNRGTGHSAIVEHVCNRLGGYAPDIRHRTDDGLMLRALVSSGRAITLLPALIATATPRVAARPIAAANVQRTIFTAVRASAASCPALETTHHALLLAPEHAARERTDAQIAG